MRPGFTTLSTSSKHQLPNTLHYQKSSSIRQYLHRPPMYHLGDMLQKLALVVVLTLLLGDAGNPIGLKGKKGKTTICNNIPKKLNINRLFHIFKQ